MPRSSDKVGALSEDFGNQGRSAIDLLKGRLYWDKKLLSDTDERRSYPPLVYTEKKRQSALYETNADR